MSGLSFLHYCTATQLPAFTGDVTDANMTGLGSCDFCDGWHVTRAAVPPTTPAEQLVAQLAVAMDYAATVTFGRRLGLDRAEACAIIDRALHAERESGRCAVELALLEARAAILKVVSERAVVLELAAGK